MSNTIDAAQSYATQASEQYVQPEYPEAREAGQLVQGPSGYSYGYAAPDGGLPPFLSDGELMLWMQTKSEEMYSRVRDVMDVSTERSKLMQDLTHLQQLIDSAEDPETVAGEMEALSAAYAGTPYEAEVAALCGPEAQAKIRGQAYVAEFADLGYDDAISKDIQAQVDKFARDDRLAFLTIQELMSDIRETAQLTSNMVSSSHQASSDVIGNIR